MNWHEVFSAAYQIPLCFSAALLIASIGRALLRDLADWMAGNCTDPGDPLVVPRPSSQPPSETNPPFRL
jgi:hypothetical protein